MCLMLQAKPSTTTSHEAHDGGIGVGLLGMRMVRKRLSALMNGGLWDSC